MPGAQAPGLLVLRTSRTRHKHGVRPRELSKWPESTCILGSSPRSLTESSADAFLPKTSPCSLFPALLRRGPSAFCLPVAVSLTQELQMGPRPSPGPPGSLGQPGSGAGPEPWQDVGAPGLTSAKGCRYTFYIISK